MSILGVFKKSLSSLAERRRVSIARREQARRANQIRREEAHREAMYRKGNAFEDHVQNMFSKEHFELIHRSPSHDETNGRYVYSMKYPDLRFKEISSGRTFWVEVKYRSHPDSSGSIEWCSDKQLANYIRTRNTYRDKVYVILGVGGSVGHPNNLYCLDLDNIYYTELYYSTYKRCRLGYRKIYCIEQLEQAAS